METLKYTSGAGTTNMTTVPGNNSSHHQDSEVDSLLLSSCWAQNSNMKNEYLIDSNSMILDETMSSLTSDKLLLDSSLSQDSEIATKATMDALDSLLLNSQPISTNLAELKPLPPFTGYTGHLSINGIRGHHYHAIAQSIPEENNNTYNSYSSEQNIVSSSTCSLADSQNLQNADSSAKSLYGVDDCGGMNAAVSPADSVSGIKLEYNSCVGVNPDSCMTVGADSVSSHVKSEMENYDISSLDIAAIIGSAIADTTVPNSNQLECDDPTASRDSWMDLESWIDGACVDNTVTSQKNIIITTHDGLSEFVLPHSPQPINVEYSKNMNNNNNNGSASTLQSLLTQNYMPLLQNRLQNGPPVKPETPSSTSYGIDMISTSSPPGNVVSTTDSVLLNGRYIQQTHYGVISGSGISDRMQSPDMLGQNYPHTTTTTNIAPKKSRSRAQKKQQQHLSAQQQQQQATSSTVFQSEQSLGLLGKEKPVHRCNICNRGFLNKSNIKVHLRTHTGEKPFRCDTCAKAFRQKAHLIKHQQIHKRIGRD